MKVFIACIVLALAALSSLGFIISQTYNEILYDSDKSFTMQSVYFTAGEVDDARQLQEQGLLAIEGFAFHELSRQTRVKPSYTWNPDTMLFELSLLEVLEPATNMVEMWRGDPRFEIALMHTFEVAVRTTDSLIFNSVVKYVNTPDTYLSVYGNETYHYEHGRMRVLIGTESYDRIMGSTRQYFEDEYLKRGIATTFGEPLVEYRGHYDGYALLEMYGKENMVDSVTGTVHHDNYRRTSLIYPKVASTQKHRKFTFFVIDFYGQNQYPLTGNAELAAIADVIISTFTPTVEE